MRDGDADGGTVRPDLDAGARASIRGKTVVVTGASRGLGRALALALAGAGARVAVCARGADALEATVEEALARGAEMIGRPVDVTRADEVVALIRAVEERWGPADAVVNNASLLGERGPVRDQSTESWRRVLDVNLTGTFIVTRAVLPGMRRAGRGSIVNIGSGVGNRPRADWGAYAVSKWAVEALTYNLAIEERDAGIRVNVVDPGRMRTAMRRAAYPEEDPATLPDPGESTGVFLWLVSDASRDVTGQRFEAASMR